MARKAKRQDEVSKSTKTLAELLGLPPPPPDPTECPDCSSRSILPICYGSPGPEMQEEARREEIYLGGCVLRNANWYCSDCFNRWPENPPPRASPGTPERHIAERAAEYASLTADAALPPEPDEPVVEDYWQRSDGRKIFLLRCPWGRVRLEKRLHLVALGGTPLYEQIGGKWPPIGFDYTKPYRQAALAAVRFERRGFS
jgi:hypothetical protein